MFTVWLEQNSVALLFACQEDPGEETAGIQIVVMDTAFISEFSDASCTRQLH
jgi:hypothetical protein